MHKSDQEIISDLKKAGNQDLAFQMLVEKYQERLYWHIRKIVLDHDDADDILQNGKIQKKPKVWYL